MEPGRNDWPKSRFRRFSVDMHIPDWDECFLAKFDAKRYLEVVCLTGTTALMHYANLHLGLCYYPTKVGARHQGIGGRDIFGEVLQLCHEQCSLCLPWSMHNALSTKF